MNKSLNALVIIFFIISLSSIFVFGQKGIGSIKGRVHDPEFGNLTGATVIVLKTNLGAATDTSGLFNISNIPFGKYAIKCRFIGYPHLIDTVYLTKENPVVNLDFAMNMENIPIIMPDSLQEYHNLISTLDPSRILEIHIDSVSMNFNFIYLTFTNKTSYPIYLIRDLHCFNTVDVILKNDVSDIVKTNYFNICDDFYGFMDLPQIFDLILLKPHSSLKFPRVENFIYGRHYGTLKNGKYYLTVKYKMKDFKSIHFFGSAPSQDDYYSKNKEGIYLLNRATRGVFYSSNEVEIVK